MSSQHRLWRGKTGGGAFGQMWLFFILSFVPVCLLYPFLYVSIPFYILFRRKDYRTMKRYFMLRHHYSEKAARKAVWRNFFIFGEVVIDKFAFMVDNIQQFSIDIDHDNEFWKILQKPQGVFVLSAHVGNFELAGHCLQQNKKRLNYVAYGGESVTFQHQRERSSLKTKVNLISVTPDISHLFAIKQAADNGEMLAIPCDRLLGSTRKITVDFLGAPADFPFGTFRIACQLQVQVCAIFVMKIKGTHYHAYVRPLTIHNDLPALEQAKDLANQYVAELEKIVRQYPEQWFNFFPFWLEN